MIDVSDLPLVGRVTGTVSVALDVLLNSGDLVLLLVEMIVGNLGPITTILSTMESLAQYVPILPSGLIETLLTAALVALVVIEVGRLVSRLFGGADTQT